MSYRIEIGAEARTLLRSFAPHVVLWLGRALAQVAEAREISEAGDPAELHIEDCVAYFAIDHARRVLHVMHVEHRRAAATNALA